VPNETVAAGRSLNEENEEVSADGSRPAVPDETVAAGGAGSDRATTARSEVRSTTRIAAARTAAVAAAAAAIHRGCRIRRTGVGGMVHGGAPPAEWTSPAAGPA
jgi:hypothetical protein